ncbi:hypothetical protein GGD55_001000 [Rhizobium giardinii]|uniref:Uncharacterized protein n=1 Tax=Rhizobium giardinii TaxID=56731 RepID=A0A7W8U7L0_9HYPH|nr:hypothetical protein [Rhizobium giardinii]
MSARNPMLGLPLALSPHAGRGDDGEHRLSLLPVPTGRRWPAGRMRGSTLAARKVN